MNRLSRADTEKPPRSFDFDDDIWFFEDLGVEPNDTHGLYRLNFANIQAAWLKHIAKQYVQLMCHQRSISTLRRICSCATLFSAFLSDRYPQIAPSDIQRTHIVEFMRYLKTTGRSLNPLIYINTLILFSNRFRWCHMDEAQNLIYREDHRDQRTRRTPRFIPESVMQQLNQHIADLKPYTMRLILVLQECGMRISEALSLAFHCLIQDEHGDYFLKMTQAKMKREHTIPVTLETVAVIREQQAAIRMYFHRETRLLFPNVSDEEGSRPKRPERALPYGTVMGQLNRLAKDKQIVDADGQLWRFQTHQFRHTVGTRMINNGVPQHIVQRFLGHDSPAMTSVYAHILDSTLKEAFKAFHGQMINLAGDVCGPDALASDLAAGAEANDVDNQWLKRNIAAQSLANGLCTLPVVKNACPHANACLTCTHFRTDARFLAQHKEHLARTQRLLDHAKQQGWQRQVEMNERLKTNLETLIRTLESTP